MVYDSIALVALSVTAGKDEKIKPNLPFSICTFVAHSLRQIQVCIMIAHLIDFRFLLSLIDFHELCSILVYGFCWFNSFV
jgi:hypothetical protein